MRHLALLLSALTIAACSQSAPPAITANQPAPHPLAGLRTTNTQAQSLQSDETLIPYSDLLTYAPNWQELSRQRLGQ